MGLLHHLWDDTLAGPLPDSGLGKLRKFSSFSPSSSTTAASTAANDAVQVTRSITIVRTSSSAAPSPRTPSCVPDSPVGPPTPKGEWRRFRRKAASAADGIETTERSRNVPNVYDWMVISSLDR